MPALATVELRPTYNAKPRQARISAKVKVAIDAMVIGGLSRDDAAKHAGIADNTLYIALRKPEVLQYRMTQMEVMRTSESSRTFARIAKLADNADSEHVRLDASKHLGALDGISPVTKSESTINHKGLGPGLTIIMAQPEAVRVIDSQAHEVEYVSREKHLALPVPHPAMGTRMVSQCGEVEITGDSLASGGVVAGKNGEPRNHAGTPHAPFSENPSSKKSPRKKRGKKLFAHKEW